MGPFWGSFFYSGVSSIKAAEQQTPVPIAPPRVDSSKGPPRKIGILFVFFTFFRPTQKNAREGPKWGREFFFPTNPDLADILGRMDFDFETFYFFDCFDQQFPDFQDFQISGKLVLIRRETIFPKVCAPRSFLRPSWSCRRLQASQSRPQSVGPDGSHK